MKQVERVGVAVFGLGRMGRQLVCDLGRTEFLELKAAVTTSPEKAGRDVGELCDLPPLGVAATTELDSVLRDGRISLLFYCGLGEPEEVATTLGRIAEAGKDAITVTGLVHPQLALGDEEAARLAQQAQSGGARLVGAGWNPGFLLDVLPVVYGSSCVTINKIYAQRVAEMRDWGAGVHEECGIGRLPADVTDTNSNPLHESVAVIVEALGLDVDGIDNHHEPYVTITRRSHQGTVIEPGHNAGFHKRSIAHRQGEAVVEVEMYAIFCIDPQVDPVSEGARIRVEGDATVETAVSGDWFGDSYPVTSARAIRAVLPLRSLPPGLYRPDQLPLSGAGGTGAKITSESLALPGR
jgi:4-hydroxy-tetrahydrodipicolinate reductase